MTHLDMDDSGFPVMLAAATEAADEKASVPPVKIIPPSTRPATVDHTEWSRRQDAVRDAAREFDDLTEQDLKERLRGLTSKPLEDGDLAQFRADVRAVVLDDLADILDHKTQGRLRGRRTVRVQPPRGYLKKTMRSLDQAEADQLEIRLRARGWSDKQIKDDLWGKIPHLTKDAVEPDPGSS